VVGAARVRVAAVQAAPRLFDLTGTLDLLDRWARRAAADGAQIVVFPETWLTGYPAWIDTSPEAALWGHAGARAVFERLFEHSLAVPGPECDRISALAAELRVTLVVGAHERAGRSLYNVLLTFGPDGRLLNHHRKLVPTYTERLLWGQGDGSGLRVVEAGGVRLGGLICWEHWMPAPRQVLHDAGEQIHVAAWPSVKEMHLIASRHYAFEGRCFVVACGSLLRASDLPPELPASPSKAPTPETLIEVGGSAIIAPNGRILAGPVMNEEAVVVADCDLGEIVRESMTLDVSGHYSRPDLFRLEFTPGSSSSPRTLGPPAARV
jgi:predicted amidohydrolase